MVLPSARVVSLPLGSGLVPKQYSTGDKPHLLGISKRGNAYLRRMFIHGARAAVLRLKRETSLLGKWMDGLDHRCARNVVIVAVANKLARIAWAVLAKGESYHPVAALIKVRSFPERN